MGPAESQLCGMGTMPREEMRPMVGLIEDKPHLLAG